MTDPHGRSPLGLHLSHVALRAEDPAALAGFYVGALGLTTHEILDGDTHRLGWGRGHHCLEITAGPRGLDHFGLEIRDPAAFDRLMADGIAGEWQRPAGEHAESFVVTDPEGHRVELHGPIDRSGEHSADPGRRPVRVQHLTLATREMARMTAFYEETLGFCVSDRMDDVFTWLRGNVEHHTLALVKAAEAGIDHYSYDVDSWDDFKVWCDELATRGVQVAWGPGRHGPGNNLFIIFDDAAGFRVELSAEMERYWDDRAEYAPRRWRACPETVNLWGPTPSWREVARGAPERASEIPAP